VGVGVGHFMAADKDLASCIQKGTLDWERALRCIKHALRTTPSPEWWKRVLVMAPCHKPQAVAPIPGAVFTSEMICEATIDRIVELLKLTNSVTLYLYDVRLSGFVSAH
ncbi:Mediator of RNA polymerase II transcription subunit 23-like protein, partial [Drosera capensis]